MSSSKILGPDGKTINPPEDQNLQVLIDTAVEAKVNTATDNMRQHLNDQINKKSTQSWISYGVTILFFLIINGLLWLIGPNYVKDWTKDFVAENMNKPHLKKAADDIMRSSMKGYIDSKLLDTENRLENVGKRLHNLKEEQEFLIISYRAQLYDFNAFRRLESIASSPNSLFSEQAKEVIKNIKRRLEFDRFNFTEYIPMEKINNKRFKGPFTNDEIAIQLMSKNLKDIEGAVNYIRRHNLKIFTADLVRLLNKDQNLNMLNRISYALSKVTGKNFEAWEIEKIFDWWRGESKNYTEWPMDRFIAGQKFLVRNKYSDALSEFNAVLKVDPDADTSRALAVACSVEMGNMNNAKELMKGFQTPRWKKLAEAKIKLGEGNSEEATDIVFQSIKQYPSFKKPYLIGRTNIWKGLEWDQIEQVMK